MIRFCPKSEINSRKWDETVLGSRSATVFATYDILSCLTGNSGWSALIMDDYDYVMPLPERSKLGIHYIFSPFFVPELGIFSKHKTTAAVTLDFFNAIPSRYALADLLFNTENDTSAIESHTVSTVSHDLNLQLPYAELYTRFSQNTRRNLGDARKHGVKLVYGNNIETIITLFRQNRGKDKNVHFREEDYRTLKKTATLLQSTGKLEVPEVYADGGELIAGALFVEDCGRLRFWFSGRNNDYAACKPMFFLMDEYIRTHAGQPLILDFNGSRNANVARLYRGFGGHPYTIKMLHYIAPSPLRGLIRLYGKVKRRLTAASIN